MEKFNEREIAAYALIDIVDSGGYNNIVLKKTLSKYNGIAPVKKNMVTEIVNGTLRNLILIDYIIGQFSTVSENKMKPFIKSLLRISIYQLIFMDKVPHSAVCNEAVKLVRTKGLGGLSGYVNGVLRNVSRNKDNIEYPNPTADFRRFVSIKYSYPMWLVDYWMGFLSDGEIISTCQASNTPPSVSVCINTHKLNINALKLAFDRENVAWKEIPDFPNALSIKGFSDLRMLESFKSGLFHVMDTSSMKSVDLLSPKSGEKILDICSAPGSKSFYAALLMKNSGRILSCDIHEHRLALVEEGTERLGLDIIETSLSDGSIFHSEFESKWDGVILDAPCSGFGVLRKKPDTKYTKSMEDVESLASLQRKLLQSSWKYPKIGGRLLYSTCTISKKENEDNINWFTSNFPYELGGSFTIFPAIDGGDGFFAASLIRKG